MSVGVQTTIYDQLGPIGYIIIGRTTGLMDWSDEIYRTPDGAVMDLCGPFQEYCQTEFEEGDEKTVWWKDYSIHPVMGPIDRWEVSP